MKSQRRHELKLNTGVEVLKRWGFHMFLGVAVVIALIYISITLYKSHNVEDMNRHTRIGQWLEQVYDSTAVVEDAVQEQRDELTEEDDFIGALSFYLLGRDAMLKSTTPQARKEDGGRKYRKIAEEKFNKVLEFTNDDFEQCPQIHAKAYLGLARLAEEDQDVDLAISYYQKVLVTREVKGHPIYVIAGKRKSQLEQMDESGQKILWAKNLTPRMKVSKLGREMLNEASMSQGDNADAKLLEYIDLQNTDRDLVLKQINAVRPLLKPGFDRYGQRMGVSIEAAKVSGSKAMLITNELKPYGENAPVGSIIIEMKQNSQQLWFVSSVYKEDYLDARKILDKFMN